MTKLLPVVVLTFFASVCCAQDDVDRYVKDHHNAFSLDSGFNAQTTAVLQQELKGYRLLLLGEGGSHFLQFYEPLRFIWVKLLNEQLGMTHFFLEFGHSSASLCNQYLQTGDTSYLPLARRNKTKIFWTKLFSLNRNQPVNQRVNLFGIDFENSLGYTKALKLLLPDAAPPAAIATAVNGIKTASDSANGCKEILAFNAQLKEALQKNRDAFKEYLLANFDAFEEVVFNNGNCEDAQRNRNKHMAENFLQFDKRFNDKIYFGQLGMAHTILTNENVASLINGNASFKNKVCVVNTFCYNCTTNEEPVSNWPLRKMESDVLKKLLPYCVSDFTLFDFTEDNAATKKFRAFGQFLIVAKNQN